ncbi:hypothetical protein MPER_15278, partial [Moniliophthora perniciosa FA553]
LILEGKVEGRIDQVGMRLELDRKWVEFVRRLGVSVLTPYSFSHRQSLEKKRYAALQKWTEALESAHSTVVGKTSPGSRGGDPTGMGMAADAFSMREDRW